MAISDWSALYPNRALSPSAEYPQGSPRNRGTFMFGTPRSEEWLLDIVGFFQALLAAGGVTADGSAETALSSQYMTALLAATTGGTVYSGSRNISGGSVTPSGWTVQELSQARYRITHNFGHSNYSGVATCFNVSAGFMSTIHAKEDNFIEFRRWSYANNNVGVSIFYIIVDRGAP